MPDVSIPPEALAAWVREVLHRAGASAEAAVATADCLVDANRRGFDTHGVVLLESYLSRLRSGAINGVARPFVALDAPALALLDGDNGLGPYVGVRAVDLCCEKAEAVGAAVVVARNANHFGAASFYANRAATRGFVALAFSNAGPGMAPRGALGPILGTNPLAVAAPAAEGVPLPSLDIATSVVAWGRVAAAAREGLPIPEGWAIGPDGEPTADPERALEGAMLPMADYKGFGLAFMIDVLTACLSGASISPDISVDLEVLGPESIGYCFVVVPVARLRGLVDYERDLRRLADAVHGGLRAEGVPAFMIPGEREARCAEERAAAIPLHEKTIELLERLAAELGTPLPIEARPAIRPAVPTDLDAVQRCVREAYALYVPASAASRGR